MQVFNSIIETQKYLKSNSNIGFIPTMGALHDGHLELVKRSKKENSITVCSIFVNPTQFNNSEDLAIYPRTLEKDCELLKSVGCDVVFAPSSYEMYSEFPALKIDFGYLETILEGKFRPGHFNGVGIVVAKLFNIIKPERAYFGLKDLQQVAVINRLVKDLSFNIEIIPCKTVREKSGLAMSSRNRRLSENGLNIAPKIYESLNDAKTLLLGGSSVIETLNIMVNKYNSDSNFDLEYFEITDFPGLKKIDKFNEERKTAIIIAVYLEGVRLIDNLVF